MILLFTAGILCNIDWYWYIEYQDTQNNNVNEKDTISDLGKIQLLIIQVIQIVIQTVLVV